MNFDNQLIIFKTLFCKEIRRFMRIWMQTLLPPVITMALYFVIFGAVIGSRVGQMAGFTYMQYVVPGLIMMAVINNSYSNVASSFFSSKFQRCIEELLVAPASTHTIILGYVCGGMVRGMIVGFIVTLLSLFFTKLHIHSIGITVLAVLLSSLLFSLGGLINAIYAKSFDDISIIPTFFLSPLTYLGGVFYSISVLPEFWQNVSHLNPILYMVNAFRYGVLGYSDNIHIGFALAIISIFLLALYVFAYYLISSGKGLKH